MDELDSWDEFPLGNHIMVNKYELKCKIYGKFSFIFQICKQLKKTILDTARYLI